MSLKIKRFSEPERKEHSMNMWVRRQISVLRECFSNASHWVRQRIPVRRERFHNASHIDQLLLITVVLFMLSLPIYLFVPTSRMGEIFTGILFGTLIVDYLRRERYPALKRWIAETEHGRNNGKDPYGNEELPPPPPAGRRVFRIFGRIFSYRIFSKWQSLQLFDRLYVLAFTIAGLGLVSLPIYGKPTKFLYGSFLLAYGVSGIGFGIWLW
jgi:hypothetical protein